MGTLSVGLGPTGVKPLEGPWGSRLCVLFRVLFPELGTPGVFTTEGEALKGLIKGLGEADFVVFRVLFPELGTPGVFTT
jgi:hypothetical protein